jgi:hypothetical protein
LNGESPDIYPLGWSNSVLRDNNIPQEYMAEALKINQDLDNNWNRIIQKIKDKRSGSANNATNAEIVLPDGLYLYGVTEETKNNEANASNNQAQVTLPLPSMQSSEEKELNSELQTEMTNEPKPILKNSNENVNSTLVNKQDDELEEVTDEVVDKIDKNSTLNIVKLT